MIDITDNKPWAIYVRTNRHVHWKYAKYGGRYETPKKALEVAKEHMHEPFEYQIEKLGDPYVTPIYGDIKLSELKGELTNAKLQNDCNMQSERRRGQDNHNREFGRRSRDER